VRRQIAGHFSRVCPIAASCPSRGAAHAPEPEAGRYPRAPSGPKRTSGLRSPLDEIDLLVGWRAGEDEYLFTKAVAMVREWLLDSEEKDRLRKVLKEILAEAGPPAGNRPLD